MMRNGGGMKLARREEIRVEMKVGDWRIEEGREVKEHGTDKE